MKDAWKYSEEFKKGQRVKREFSVGPIVPWALVAVAALATGKGWVGWPEWIVAMVKHF